MRIAICDDNKNEINQIFEVVSQIVNKLEISAKINLFHSGKDILKEKMSYDLLLLDIELNDMNGISLAKKIRKYNRNCIIIFISNYNNYLQEGYKVHAERYFIKPLDSLEFEIELKEILKEYIIDTKFIFDLRIANYKILIKDILYIEYYQRKTIIHTLSNDYSTTITIKEWLTILDGCYFSQCHKAFIINLKHIKDISKNNILLENNDELVLTRKFKKTFIDNYHQYLGGKI